MTPETALAAARDVAELASELADQTEADRRLNPDVYAAMKERGLLRLGLPSAYGGLQLDPLTLYRAIQTVARGDASAGWVLMVVATTCSVAAAMDPVGAEEIYANGEAFAAGVTAPSGTAVPVEGGFEVTGRWGYGSGVDHVDWMLGGCLVKTESGVEMAGSRPRILLAAFPTSEVTIEDTWDVLGVRGSGSQHFGVEGLFVPAHRTTDLGGPLRIEAPQYTFPVFTYLAMGIAGVALGTARRAIDEFVGLAGAKKMAGSSRTLAERPNVQAAVAGAEARLRSAVAFIESAMADAWSTALEHGEATIQERALARLACSHGTTAAAEIVTGLHVLAGGAALYDGVLQRCFRDVHAATQHLMVAPSTYELTGRLLLGLETDVSQL